MFRLSRADRKAGHLANADNANFHRFCSTAGSAGWRLASKICLRRPNAWVELVRMSVKVLQSITADAGRPDPWLDALDLQWVQRSGFKRDRANCAWANPKAFRQLCPMLHISLLHILSDLGSGRFHTTGAGTVMTREFGVVLEGQVVRGVVLLPGSTDLASSGSFPTSDTELSRPCSFDNFAFRSSAVHQVAILKLLVSVFTASTMWLHGMVACSAPVAPVSSSSDSFAFHLIYRTL